MLAGVALAATVAVGQGPRSLQTMGVDEIRPGMTGYGLSVFRGTQPERFDVEVIDVLHGFRPGMDLILVRTPHPLLDQAIAVGGMSGSPIYIDGKLIGAYAYGWPFGREPIIGVTPIASMLAEMHRPYRENSFPGARPLGGRPSQRVARQEPRQVASPYDGSPVNAFTALERSIAGLPRPGGAQPAATPLMLGGFDGETARLLGERLSDFGLVAQQGGAGQSNAPGPARFVDGGSIGVQLVRGDISATAIGTVTHVGDRGRVIGFGHPMMNAGEVGLPTSTARVLHILSSLARSFKIAEGLQPLGTLVHDRQSAIVVDTELEAGTVPMRIRLHGLEQPARAEWNLEIASHRAMTPVLAFGALNNAIKAANSDNTDMLFRAESSITLRGRSPLRFVDEGIMRSGPADASALSRLRIFEAMELAFGNAFEESSVEAIEVDLHLRYGRQAWAIEGVSIDDTEVEAGSDVPVRVDLRRFGGERQSRSIQVHIPESAAGQRLQLAVAAGSGVRPERSRPRSLDDLIHNLEDRYPATSFVLSLKMPSRGLRFDGHVVRSLPRSALNSLQRTSGTGPRRPFVTYLRRSEAVGELVTGSAQLNLQVVAPTPRDR